MLSSSKNDESDGNKTFEVYSSYITVASNILKKTKRKLIRALCNGLYRNSTKFVVRGTHMNGACNGNFFLPRPLGLWGGFKRSNII